MSFGLEDANNLAGAAALMNGLILWPIVRSLQKAVTELKDQHIGRPRGVRTGKSRRPGTR